MKNALYFGDNLNVMREMQSGSYHICYLDPPYNSGRNYNIFLASSKAQRKAFDDIWRWDDAARRNQAAVRRYDGRHPELVQTMDNLSYCLTGFDAILKGGRSDGSSEADSMRAYLAFMAPRLAEIWRLLTPNGSVYLHCDAHASHYLKVMLDAIFGAENFRNEIVWHYTGGGRARTYFSRKHDVILWYARSAADGYCFNLDEVRVPYKATSGYAKTGIVSKAGKKYMPNPKGTPVDDVWDIPIINPMSKERLGYPTQKPLALLERIIKASSHPEDIVFDPFCGCGTALDAAHGLGRHWVGIDLTVLALEPMERRLRERHGLRAKVDYTIEGYPGTWEDAILLAEQNPHDFANWAVTRLGLAPTANTNDGGFDGSGKVVLWENHHLAEATRMSLPVIAEVKSGRSLNPNQVRAFRTAMQDTDAAIGIFITLHPVTRGMRNLAEAAGTLEHNGRHYPRLQFWQITDAYFDDGTISVTLPWQVDERPKAERHYGGEQTYF